jgi:NADH-quinone oxidoreductase subunit N
MNLSQVLSATLPQLQPELCLVAGVLAVLLGELFLSGREKPALGWVAAAFALLAGILAFQTPSAPAGVSAMLFPDRMGAFLKALFALSTFFLILLSLRSREARLMPAGEYYAFLLAAALGCCLLATSRNLLMLYLSMEIVSYSSYLLAGFLRRDLRSNEAALKYVLYGAVASGCMLFGISTLYGMAGSLDLLALGSALGEGRPAAALAVPFGMIAVGFGFKISAAPFHQWAPDVYEGAPTPVTAFLSVAPKIAGMAALGRVAYLGLSAVPAAGYGTAGGALAVALSWPAALGVLSALTMTVGNLCALFQTNAKRMLAYSSIAHAGYMLMGLAAAGASGEGLQAVLFYAAVYAVMNLGAFGVVMAFSQVTGSEDLKAWRGLGWRHPVLGACMVVFLLSLTGLPPFAGFIGKFFLFKAALAAASGSVALPGGQEAATHWLYGLILLGLLNSVVSLYYYIAIPKALFIARREEPGPDPGSAGWLQPLTVGILAAGTLLLGICWGSLATLARQAVQGLGAPSP